MTVPAAGSVSPSDVDRLVHDLRHVLATVVAAVEVVELSVGALRGDSFSRQFAAVRDAAMLAARIADRFHADPFVSDGVCDLSVTVNQFTSVFAVSLGGRFQVVSDVAATGLVAVPRVVVESALLNLCVNAVAVMEPGGTLTVGCRPCRQRGHVGVCSQVFVADTGPGMSVEQFAAALSGATRRGPAAGIGLVSTFMSLRAVGAELSCVSRQGLGAEVCVHLPLSQDLPQIPVSATLELVSQVPSRVGGGSVPRPVVAVVDDDEVLLSYMETILRDAGVEVVTFSTCAAVVESGCVPDVALIDAHLGGGVDGDAVAHLFHPVRGTEVVFMSGDVSWLSRVSSGRGALVKPFSKDSLLAAIHGAVLRRARTVAAVGFLVATQALALLAVVKLFAQRAV